MSVANSDVMIDISVTVPMGPRLVMASDRRRGVIDGPLSGGRANGGPNAQPEQTESHCGARIVSATPITFGVSGLCCRRECKSRCSGGAE
jgi:hypothetical protein